MAHAPHARHPKSATNFPTDRPGDRSPNGSRLPNSKPSADRGLEDHKMSSKKNSPVEPGSELDDGSPEGTDDQQNPNPLSAVMPPGGGDPPDNPLKSFIKQVHDLPQGRYVARITDFSLTRDPFGELQAVLSFEFIEGDFMGRTYQSRQRITAKSFAFLRQNLENATGRALTDPDELYDPVQNCAAGQIRDDIVGAKVEIEAVHREVDDKVYINVNVVKLLQPASEKETGRALK